MTKEVEQELDLKPENQEPPELEGKVTEPEHTEEETLALARGWQTKEDWVASGKAEDEWKPAKVFNEIGSLKEKLQDKEKETKKLNKVVALMKEHHINVRQAAFKDALAALKAERTEALKQENFARAEELRDKIDEVRDRFHTAGTLPREVEKELKETQGEPDPEFFRFVDRNPWYKPGGSDEMSKKADSLGLAYASENPDWDFKQVVTEVEKDIRKLFPEKFNTPRSPVNEPGSRRSGSEGSGKSTVKLSAEELQMAKAFDMTPEEYAKELSSYRGR